MKKIILAAFLGITSISNAQEFIGPNGFFDDFNTTDQVKGDDSYEIQWFGKQTIGTNEYCTDSNYLCYSSFINRKSRVGKGSFTLSLSQNRT